MTTHGIAKKTFRGGSHPPESKELTAERRIQPGPAPKQVTLMLSQHIGAPCEPLVKKGETVTLGQKVADNEAFVCAPIHSPVDGKVKEISLQPHAVLLDLVLQLPPGELGDQHLVLERAHAKRQHVVFQRGQAAGNLRDQGKNPQEFRWNAGPNRQTRS